MRGKGKREGECAAMVKVETAEGPSAEEEGAEEEGAPL
jgi:hypothetical protein